MSGHAPRHNPPDGKPIALEGGNPVGDATACGHTIPLKKFASVPALLLSNGLHQRRDRAAGGDRFGDRAALSARDNSAQRRRHRTGSLDAPGGRASEDFREQLFDSTPFKLEDVRQPVRQHLLSTITWFDG